MYLSLQKKVNTNKLQHSLSCSVGHHANENVVTLLI